MISLNCEKWLQMQVLFNDTFTKEVIMTERLQSYCLRKAFFFSFQNDPKNLDPSKYKMGLDF